jgi:hypothetical protein
MSDPARLEVDRIAHAAERLAQAPGPSDLVAGLLQLVREWAAPSAAFAAVRDATVDGGWRLLPSVLVGSVPVGIERSLEKLAADDPALLARPGIVQRGEEIPGVRVRDNWAVPFWHGGESGALFLRGVPRPAPENLGEALALATAPAWPRLLGSPAERVEALVAEVRSVAERLAEEAGRQLETLQAQREAAPAATEDEALPAAPPAPAPDEGRLAELEEQLRATTELRQQAEERSRATREELRAAEERSQTALEQLRTAEERLRSMEEDLRTANGQLRGSEEGLQAAVAQRATLEERLHAGVEQWRAAEVKLRAAEEQLRAAEEQVRASGEPLRAAEEQLRLSEERQRVVEQERSTLGEELRSARGEAESLRGERDALRERLARAEALAAESAVLVERLEERQRAAEAAEVRARKSEEELAAAQRDLAMARARSGQQDEERRARLAEAEARARALEARWEKATSALGVATAAARRAAFLPATVRVSLQEVAGGDRPAGRLRVVFLDRDLVALEPVAETLEAAGVEVRMASHPEELALLLRTAEAGALDAVVCDVMAFRPDQNVAGMIRGWDKDRPGLAYFLSYDLESGAEVERARRIPMSLTAGSLARPLAPPRLLEAFENLARRRGKGQP